LRQGSSPYKALATSRAFVAYLSAKSRRFIALQTCHQKRKNKRPASPECSLEKWDQQRKCKAPTRACPRHMRVEHE
jgi:DNA-binding IclR family transcriptional regulator